MHKLANRYHLPARDQAIANHPEDYVMTEADKAAVGHGSALWILGKVLAKLRLLFTTYPNTEAMVYLLARRDNPHLIAGVLLPEHQVATSASVKTRGIAVVRTSREARRLGFIIVAAAHSHALMPVFSSCVDIEYMQQLSQEGCGWSSPETSTYAGSVSPRARAADGAAVPAFEVRFADQAAFSVEISTSRRDLSADDFAVSLTCRDSVQVSSFLTLNAAGEAFFPIYKVVRCACCSSVTTEQVGSDLTVHVVGEERLTAAEQAAFLEEARRRAPRRWAEHWGADGADDDSGWSRRKSFAGVAGGGLETAESGDSGSARAFQVTRHGQTRHVPPAVMEEAAYLCPSLAKALGWDEDDASSTGSHRGRADRQEEGGDP